MYRRLCQGSSCRVAEANQGQPPFIEQPRPRAALIAYEIQAIFLVGGFAASDWLYSQLKEQLAPLDLAVLRPDTHVYVPFKFSLRVHSC